MGRTSAGFALLLLASLAPACAVIDGLGGEDEVSDDSGGPECPFGGAADGSACINSSECCSQFCQVGPNVCARPTSWRITFAPPAFPDCPDQQAYSDVTVLAGPDGGINYWAGLQFMGGHDGERFGAEAYCVTNQQIGARVGSLEATGDGTGYQGTYDFTLGGGGTGDVLVVRE